MVVNVDYGRFVKNGRVLFKYFTDGFEILRAYNKNKIRLLIKNRSKNKRRGLYGYVFGRKSPSVGRQVYFQIISLFFVSESGDFILRGGSGYYRLRLGVY